MSIDRILAALALPPESRVDRRVPKKMLAEQAAPTAADKRRLLDGIEELTWAAALKPANCGLAAFQDSVREYLEIAVLTAVLRPAVARPRQVERMMELIHRAIPYPVVLIAAHTGAVSLSLAHKRWSQGEHGKMVLEELRIVQLASDPSSSEEEQFLQNLAVSHLQAGDLYGLYDSWLREILALEAARITGHFAPAPTQEAALALRQGLEVRGQLQRQLATLRKQALKERQINRRVQLNLEIQRLEADLASVEQMIGVEESA